MIIERSIGVVLCLVLLAAIVAFEYQRDTYVDLLFVFNGTYGILYGFAPIFVLLHPNILTTGQEVYWATSFQETQHVIPYATAVTLVFYLSFASVYIYTRDELRTREAISDNVIIARFHRFTNEMWLAIGYGMVTIATISFLLYSLAFDGPISVLLQAQEIRSGNLQADGATTFFSYGVRLYFLAFFLFVGLNCNRQSLEQLRLAGIGIGLITSLFALVLFASRNLAIFFIASLVLMGYLTSDRKVGQRDIAIFAAMGIPIMLIILFMRPLLMVIGGQEIQHDIFTPVYVARIIQDISVPFISLLVAIENTGISQAGWGTWFGRAFIDLIPKSLLSQDMVWTAINHNTELHGIEVDERQYSIVPGMVAYYFYELWYLAPIIGAAITGIIVATLNTAFNYLKQISGLGLMLGYLVIRSAGLMLNGDPASNLKNDSAILAALIGLIVLAWLWPSLERHIESQQAIDVSFK